MTHLQKCRKHAAIWIRTYPVDLRVLNCTSRLSQRFCRTWSVSSYLQMCISFCKFDLLIHTIAASTKTLQQQKTIRWWNNLTDKSSMKTSWWFQPTWKILVKFFTPCCGPDAPHRLMHFLWHDPHKSNWWKESRRIFMEHWKNNKRKVKRRGTPSHSNAVIYLGRDTGLSASV